MEWLQTYRIGEELLKTGKYKAIDAYLGSYYPSFNKNTKQRKTPYILDVVIDISETEISFALRAFGEGTLDDGLINSVIAKECFFTSVAGNFTSFYLSSSYGKGKEKSILDFFGIEDGKIVKDSKGFDSELTELIKKGLLGEPIRGSRFMRTRDKIRNNSLLIDLLDKAISSLSLFIDTAKNKVFEKEFSNSETIPIPLSSRLDLSLNSNSEIALVVVKIKDGDSEYYLNREQDLIEFYYKRFLSLAKIDPNSSKKGICYFKGEDQVYDVSLPRDNINILKVSTNSLTTQSNLSGENFLLSQDAYEKLKLGGWFIAKKFVVKIAGVKHYILPDFTANFDILRYKTELTEKIEIAFNLTNYKRMQQRLYHLSNNSLNSISFLSEKSPCSTSTICS